MISKELTREFIECITAELEKPHLSAYMELVLMCGVPNGVDQYDPDVIRLLNEAEVRGFN